MQKIIAQYSGFIKSVIKKVTGFYNEDLEQEVYIKTWKNLPDYKEQGSFKSWLGAITKNVCLDYFKSASYRQTQKEISGDDILANKSVNCNFDKQIDAKTRQKIILRSIDELPSKMRKVVFLCEFEELTIKEVAKKLNEPEGTVKSRLFNARKILAEKLKFLQGEN